MLLPFLSASSHLTPPRLSFFSLLRRISNSFDSKSHLPNKVPEDPFQDIVLPVFDPKGTTKESNLSFESITAPGEEEIHCENRETDDGFSLNLSDNNGEKGKRWCRENVLKSRRSDFDQELGLPEIHYENCETDHGFSRNLLDNNGEKGKSWCRENGLKSRRSDFDQELGLRESSSDRFFTSELTAEHAIDEMECSETEFEEEKNSRKSHKKGFAEINEEADMIFEILQQDDTCFDVNQALDDSHYLVSLPLVKEVLLRFVRSVNEVNKTRTAKLAYRFFVWCSQQDYYKHSTVTYNMILKIFADCNELKAMWKLVDEMIDDGITITARTFNVTICACAEAGMAKKLVQRFMMMKNFNYRPFRHSYNAILHSLITVEHYKLIEWVHERMMQEGYSPDVFTYNIIMCALYRLGKLGEFERLLQEMGRNEIPPDVHTYSILLHVLGRADKPLAALNLLNYMEDVGCQPRVLHFTNLIDGLSRAGNIDACEYFFREMEKKGCEPDVVSYTVMIKGLIVSGKIDKAENLFAEMFRKGQLPNVFTYNSMIQGLCIARKFKEACCMLEDMEARGCRPNFQVYRTLVWNLKRAGKYYTAGEVIRAMVEKGRYVHLAPKLKWFKR